MNTPQRESWNTIRSNFLLPLLFISCLGAETIDAKTYQWTDEDGNTHYSDRPPPKQPSAITEKSQSTSNKGDGDSSATLTDEAHTNAYVTPKNAGYSQSIVPNVRRLLKTRRYQELNQLLASYQIDTEKDILAEERLFTAYDAFGSGEKSLRSLLDEWVNTTPDQYQPYLARASYLYHLGWRARGGKWASETKEQQFTKMGELFQEASKDLAIVLEKNKKSLVPYIYTMGIAKAFGMNEKTGIIAAQALQIEPTSFKIREYYMGALSPRWGGSLQQMQKFAIKSQHYAEKNKKLKLLQGLPYAEAASKSSSARAYQKAEKTYNKALSYGEDHKILQKRGNNRYQLKEYDKALQDLDRAIALFPDAGRYFISRSKIHVKLGRYEDAVADGKRARLLEPTDATIQRMLEWLARQGERKGYELKKAGKPTEALSAFNASLSLQPDNAELLLRRARIHIDLQQLDKALADLEKSIELDPANISSYSLIDWVLTRRKAWNEIISYWDKFIAQRPDISSAYVERGGAYYRKGDMASAVRDAKKAAEMGDERGKEAYEKFKHLAGE